MNIIGRHLIILLLAFCAGITTLYQPPAAFAFSVDGGLQVCAFPHNCIYRTIPNLQRRYLYDTEDLLGSGNNWAIAKYYTDIARGFVGAWVKATRAWDGVWWRPASASCSAGWKDTLRFRVPAGSYPEGLKVSATGSVSGRLGKSGNGTQAAAGFFARLGNEPSGFFSGKIELGSADDDQVIGVGQPIVLEATLVPAGAEFPNPITIDLPISAGIDNPRLLASTWAGGIYEAWSLSDFARTLSIDSIGVPPGVTWDSESGVFLTQSVGSCRGDLDGDGDVDGGDTENLISDPDQLDLILYADQFGRIDCLPTSELF